MGELFLAFQRGWCLWLWRPHTRGAAYQTYVHPPSVQWRRNLTRKGPESSWTRHSTSILWLTSAGPPGWGPACGSRLSKGPPFHTALQLWAHHPSPHFSFSGPGELLPISPRIFLTPHGSVSPPCRPPLCQSSHTIFHTHCCSHTLTITCLLNRNRDLAGPGPCRIPACREGVTLQNWAPAGCLLKWMNYVNLSIKCDD